MEVTSEVKLSNFVPFVLCDIINLALATDVVGVLATNSINVIFRTEVESPVEMRKLVTTFSILHGSAAVNFVSLFVQDQRVVSDDCPNLIFFQFSTDDEYLVLGLNARKASWHDLRILNRYRCCILSD